MPRRRRSSIPIPDCDLEGWAAIPEKRWNVKASLDIYRDQGRIARKGNWLIVHKTDDGIFWRGFRLYPHEYEGLILL